MLGEEQEAIILRRCMYSVSMSCDALDAAIPPRFAKAMQAVGASEVEALKAHIVRDCTGLIRFDSYIVVSVLLEVVLCTVVLGYHWQHQYVWLFFHSSSSVTTSPFVPFRLYTSTKASTSLCLTRTRRRSSYPSPSTRYVVDIMLSRKLGESVPV